MPSHRQGLDPQTISVHALAWLASDSDLIGAFLAQSGADPAQLPDLARTAGFLAAVLDFVLQSDAMVIALAESLSVPPEAIVRARAGLPGGDLPHWT